MIEPSLFQEKVSFNQPKVQGYRYALAGTEKVAAVVK